MLFHELVIPVCKCFTFWIINGDDKTASTISVLAVYFSYSFIENSYLVAFRFFVVVCWVDMVAVDEYIDIRIFV